jgi:GTP-binding protein
MLKSHCRLFNLIVYRLFTIEDAIGYVAGDELIEVVPDRPIRLRKRIIDSGQRRTSSKRSATA